MSTRFTTALRIAFAEFKQRSIDSLKARDKDRVMDVRESRKEGRKSEGEHCVIVLLRVDRSC